MEVEAEEEAKVSNAYRCSWWLHALVHITVKWYILIARGGRTLAPIHKGSNLGAGQQNLAGSCVIKYRS